MKATTQDIEDVLTYAEQPLTLRELNRRLALCGRQSTSYDLQRLLDQMMVRKRRNQVTRERVAGNRWGYSYHENKLSHRIDKNLLTKLHYSENGQLPAEQLQAHAP